MTTTGKAHDTEKSFLTNGEVGDWVFLDKHSGIYIAIHTPGGTAVLPIDEKHHEPRWQWDGNRKAPTITPSILIGGDNEWHGWMREGELVSA